LYALGPFVTSNQNECPGEMIARGRAQNRAALRKGESISEDQPRRNEEREDGRRWKMEDRGWKMEDGRSKIAPSSDDPRSSILDPPSSIFHLPSLTLDPRSSILDPRSSIFHLRSSVD
jgi:hypothetical protein